MMRKQQGFTLIELLIVIAIIGLLAAIAYPSYVEHVRSARRTAAMSCLMEQTHFMERFYSANMSYAGAALPACEGVAAQFYNFNLGNQTASTYTLTATRRGDQAGDACGDFRVTHLGVRDNINGTRGNCWR